MKNRFNFLFFLKAILAFTISGNAQSFEQLLKEASDSISEKKLGSQTLSLINSACTLAGSGTKEESRVILQKGIYYFARYEFEQAVSTLKPRLKNLTQDTLIAKFNFFIGKSYGFNSEADSSIHYLKIAGNIFKKLEMGEYDISVHLYLGNAYFTNFQEDLAIKEYDSTLSLMTKYNDSSRYVSVMSNTAACLIQLKDLENAKEYYRKLEAEHSNNKEQIGRIYANMGAVYSEQDSFEMAKTYFEKSIPYLKSNGEFLRLGSSYYNLISVHLALNNPENAFKNAKLAEPIYVKYNPARLGFLYYGFGSIYASLDSTGKALEFYTKALDIAIDGEQWLEAKSTTQQLSLLYEKEGDLKKSLFFLKEFTHFNEKVFDSKKLEAIERYKTQFEAAEQKQKIAQLKELNSANQQLLEAKQRNQLISYSIFVAIAILFIIGVTIHSRFKLIKLKAKNNIAVTDLNNKLLLNRLNPHFTFNVLNSIQYYINTENKQKANQYLNVFADLLRKFLNSFGEDFHSLEEELTLISEYVELEKILKKDSFEFVLTIDPTINTNTRIPTMLIQPLLENSIKHGTTDENPLIKLQFKNSEKHIICMLEDNGAGLDTNVKSQESKGINLVMERIKLLNLNSKNKISLMYPKKAEKLKGLLIRIEIPKSF